MAVLEVRRPDQSPETVRVTRRKPITIGSHPNSSVPVEEADAMHCRIAWNGEGYEVVAAGEEDIDLNGQPTRQSLLDDGDKIRVSDVVIKMHRGNKTKAAVEDILDDEIEEPPEEKTPPAPPSGAAISAGDVVEDSAEEAKPDAPERDPVRMSVRDRIRSRRPGQNSPLQSPLIYAMAAGVVALMVAFLALSLFIRGKAIAAEFDTAKAAYAAEKYGEAEEKLSQFVLNHPGHPLAGEAKELLAFTKLDRLVKGASPDYPKGLQELESLVAGFRDGEGFEEMKPLIAERAGIIAKGAATAAGGERDEGLINLSRRAEKALVEYSAVPPKGLLDEIEAARHESRATMVRLDLRDNFLGRMTASEKNGRPLEVIDQYLDMVTAEPLLQKDRETTALNETALESVLTRVAPAEFEAAAAEGAAAGDWAVRTIAVVERPAGEGQGDGVAVTVWADDTLFASDRQSGDPLWMRPLPGSFEPVRVDVPSRGRLAFDSQTRSLLLISDEDGSTAASLGVGGMDRTPGRPTVVDGTAFVPFGDRLLRLNLAEMRVTASTGFAQDVLPSPAYVRGEPPAVLVLGDEQMAYLLDATTLELRDSLVLGHDRGTVIAPPLAAAEFSIVVTNDAARSSTMHLLADRGGRLAVADTAKIEGTVVEPPVLRGKNLYVPTSGEIVAVMAVREDDGGRLAGGPKFSPGSDETEPVPAYLLAEADREFWLAGRRLRRLQVTAESVQPIDRAIPLGRPSQPPVGTRGAVLVAARRGGDDAVTLSRVETAEMRERWQTHYAGELIASVPVGEDGLVGVTSHGHFVRVKLGEAGFQTDAVDKSDGTPDSAVALSNRIAVADGAKVVFVSTTGRRQGVQELGEEPTAPLVNWNDSLVIPLPGKLRVLAQRGRPAPADFWLGQQGEEAPPWTGVHVLDESRLVTTDAGGTVRVLTLASQPRPFLQESAAAALPEGASAVAAGAGRIFALAGGAVAELDPGSLAAGPAAEIPGGTIRHVTATDFGAVVLTESGGVTTASLVRDGSVAASQELEGVPAAPAVVRNGQIVVTLDRGVTLLASDSLGPVSEWPLPSAAAAPADLVGGTWVVPLDNGGVATRR